MNGSPAPAATPPTVLVRLAGWLLSPLFWACWSLSYMDKAAARRST